VSLGSVQAKLRAALELPSDALVPLQSVIIAEDITEPQNNSQLDERLSVGLADIAAIVGEFAHIQLFNPANSGVLGVVQDCWIDIETAGLVRLRKSTTQVTGTEGAKSFRDSRITGDPACQVVSDNRAAVLGTQLFSIDVDVSPSLRVPIDYILSPGNGIQWHTNSADVDLGVTWRWRELALPNL